MWRTLRGMDVEWRQENGLPANPVPLSQTELAQLAGVSRNTISNIERGKSRPIRAVRELIADALEVPVEYVLELR